MLLCLSFTDISQFCHTSTASVKAVISLQYFVCAWSEDSLSKCCRLVSMDTGAPAECVTVADRHSKPSYTSARLIPEIKNTNFAGWPACWTYVLLTVHISNSSNKYNPGLQYSPAQGSVTVSHVLPWVTASRRLFFANVNVKTRNRYTTDVLAPVKILHYHVTC